jgi:hypothetical protein
MLIQFPDGRVVSPISREGRRFAAFATDGEQDGGKGRASAGNADSLRSLVGSRRTILVDLPNRRFKPLLFEAAIRDIDENSLLLDLCGLGALVSLAGTQLGATVRLLVEEGSRHVALTATLTTVAGARLRLRVPDQLPRRIAEASVPQRDSGRGH